MKKAMLLALAALALGPMTGAMAQPAPAPAPAAPDAAHLAAAKALVGVLYTEPRRQELSGQLVQAMLGTIVAGLAQPPGMKEALQTNAEVQKIVKAFLEQRKVAAEALIKADMPAMLAAMERAYARRFTVAEMTELTSFFSSPVGKAYSERTQSINTDPDVVAWQQQILKRNVADAQRDAPALSAKLTAAVTKAAKSKNAPPKK